MKMHTLKTLMLDGFIEAVICGNIKAVVIKGNPSEIELNEHWETLIDEYYSIAGNSEYKIANQEAGRMECKQLKIQLVLNNVEALLNLCSIGVTHVGLLANMAELGYPVTYKTQAELRVALEMVRDARIKKEVRELRTWKKDRAEEAQNRKPITEKYFTDMVSAIEITFQGVQIEPSTTSAWRFAGYVSRLRTQHMKAAVNKAKR